MNTAMRAFIEAAVEETIAQAQAEHCGDDFACIEEHDCRNPTGHVFMTACGATKCLHCGVVAWR